jgi:hypothetical protein
MITKLIVNVEKDYRCPFCSDHEDCYYVIWEGIMETPICDGCDWEFKYYFLSSPQETVCFGSSALPMEERIPMLEKITGTSIYDLQMSVVLGDLLECCDRKNYDAMSNQNAEKWGDNVIEREIQKKRREWDYRIRQRKKLIRQIMRLQEKKGSR